MYGSMTPSARFPGATAAATVPGRRGSSTIGRRGLASSAAAVSSTSASSPRRRQAGRHHRERLVLPVLARPQRRGRRLAARVHRQVVAAEPLHRQHLPVPQQRGRRRQRVAVPRVPSGGAQAQPRPAGGAAHRLGVEPAVRRVVVLRRARPAHGEGGHRGVGPVVGHVGHDGEPGPAVGAVDERVPMPPVRGIEEFGQAVGAHGAVGRHQGGALRTRCARRNREPRSAVSAACLLDTTWSIRPAAGHHVPPRPGTPPRRRRALRPRRTRPRSRCRRSRTGPAAPPASRRTGGTRPPGPSRSPGPTAPGPRRCSPSQCGAAVP